MTAISLEAFLEAAAAAELVELAMGPDGPGVRGVGTTPDGRRVAWVDPQVAGALPKGAADVVDAFVVALEESYGRHITELVQREVALRDYQGRPVPSDLIKRAVKMARSSQSLYAGSNFMCALEFSAVRGGPALDEACAACGTRPDAMGPHRRALADDIFRRAFARASGNDTRRVERDEAAALFGTAVKQALAVDEDVARQMTSTGGPSC